jgi:ferredoxin
MALIGCGKNKRLKRSGGWAMGHGFAQIAQIFLSSAKCGLLDGLNLCESVEIRVQCFPGLNGYQTAWNFSEATIMAIERIDPGLCNGCGICVNSCPADVIRMDPKSKKAVIGFPQDCVVCCWCIAECPQDAVFISPVVKTSPLFTSWG